MIASKKHNDPAHKSFGLDNLRKRMAQISIIQNKEVSLQFDEEKDAEGNVAWTVVTIKISLEQ